MFLTLNDISDPEFNCKYLIRKRNKPAKEVQEIAFKIALVSNVIISLPTGFGKTFIASLVMAKMRELNNRHLVVMVVDRVPLVYQQAVAIADDTGMYVCQYNGSSATQGKLKQLIIITLKDWLSQQDV